MIDFKDPEFQAFLNQMIEKKIAEHEAKKDPVEEFIKLSNHPKVKLWFDNTLLTSELKPIQRIYKIEKEIGLVDPEYLDDEEPNIPERIETLRERIETLADEVLECSAAPAQKTIDPRSIIPETKTEARALFLVEYLENEVKERNGELFLNGNEIKDFITRIIPTKDPELAPKKDQNIRKIKKDVLAKVKKIFGNKIEINANKHGRRETRVLLRSYPSVPT